MTKMLADGNIKWTFVPTANGIANIALPTVAELTAGGILDLEWFITADGLGTSVDEAVVALPVLAEDFDAEGPGRNKYGFDLTMYRHLEEASDKAWTTCKKATVGFGVKREGLPVATAYQAGQRVKVYPIIFGERKDLPTEANGGVKFVSHVYVSSRPNLDAVVA